MKLVTVEKASIPRRPYTNWLEILEEFLNSDADCVRLEGWTNKNAYYCQNAIHKAINAYRLSGVRAMSSNGEVYLIKTV